MSMNPREINRMKKARRKVLEIINLSNPNPVMDKAVLDELDNDDAPMSRDELRQIMQYLADLNLIETDTARYGGDTIWAARIKALGVDFLMGIGDEYQGIA